MEMPPSDYAFFCQAGTQSGHAEIQRAVEKRLLEGKQGVWVGMTQPSVWQAIHYCTIITVDGEGSCSFPLSCSVRKDGRWVNYPHPGFAPLPAPSNK